jgi:RHS repeat-associated protein
MKFVKLVLCAVGLTATAICWTPVAFGQADAHLPPRAQGTSPTGVNYKSGAFSIGGIVDLSIGEEGLGGLQLIRSYSSSNDGSLAGMALSQGWTFNTSASIVRNPYVYRPDEEPGPPHTRAMIYTVMTGSTTSRFRGGFANSSIPTTGTYLPYTNNGETLVFTKIGTGGAGSGSYFTFTDSIGVVYIYSANGFPASFQSVTFPDGTTLTRTGSPKRMLISNRGYALFWESANKVCAINMAESYVPSTMTTCPAGAQTVTYAFSTNLISATDAAGFTTNYSYVGANHLGCIKDPGQTTCRINNIYSVCPPPSPTEPANRLRDQVISQTTATGESYSYSISNGDVPCYGYPGYGATAVVTAPLGTNITVYTNGAGSVANVTDSLGRAKGYDFYYGVLDPEEGVLPSAHNDQEGNGESVVRNGRGNITERWLVPKIGSGLSSVKLASASFPGTCTNRKTCNKPIWIRDSKGNQTDYTYDSVHGGILTETKPADASGVRPQKRFGYTQLYAWIKGASGAYVQAPSAVWMLTSISECRSLSSCVGSADEIRQTITYGSAGVANNLLPTSVTIASGDGSVSVTTNRTYDFSGNVLTLDGPLPGNLDTTRYRYNSLRRLTGKVDPPGASGKCRATRYTYDGSGRISKVERGTVNSQSDADWSSFVSLEAADNSYDLMGRLIRETKSGSGTIVGVTQYDYDAAGRLNCKAVRMDPTQWLSQSNACIPQTNGAYGPDRITQNFYNTASEVTSIKVALGTADESVQVVNTFTPNGKPKTMTDGEGNLTTYLYDGYDRPTTTKYPDKTAKGVSSSTDYEQAAYDFNGNITQRRLRDGQLINFTFDNLNRMLLKDLPAPESDVQFQLYDLQGNLKRVVQGASTVEMAWDTLGRNTSSTSDVGTMLFQLDALNRRTRITWPDGFYITQEFLPTGELSAIREYGATSGPGVLATYSYDDLGRRVSITRGNGVSTIFGYDSISRLASLSHNLAGTAGDVAWTYSLNPADQLTSVSRDNDAYAWAGHYNTSMAYAVNGLNQFTAAGSTDFGYDFRGNLSGIGANLYSYTVENRMVSAPGGATLSYDSTGRLSSTSKAGVTTRFQYDGVDLVAEYNASYALVRRYVHGPGTDEPLVWYEGSGTSDRRWYHQDERGSIVSLSNSSGTLLATNTYDEFGNPGASNLGRFSYTGQTWLPEVALYYFKARMYSSVLGRFMQGDPRGPQDGPNLYWYAKGDPVNGTDPTGEVTIVTFGPRDAAAISYYSSVRFDGGVFIAGHANSSYLVDDRPNAMMNSATGYVYRELAPRALLALITRDAGSSPTGKPIILAGCKLGKESFAQDLAVRNRSIVIAPEGYIQATWTSRRGDSSNGKGEMETRELVDEETGVLSGEVKSWAVYGPDGQLLGKYRYISIDKKKGTITFSGGEPPTGTRIMPHLVCDEKGCSER